MRSWCALFADYEFSVGVSLDGGAGANDAFRITHSGKGTYDHILSLLQRYDLMQKIGVLTTVTRHNVDQ